MRVFFSTTKLIALLHSFLKHTAGEAGAIVIRICAYFGTLAALALLGTHLLSEVDRRWPAAIAATPAPQSRWVATTPADPAFAILSPELAGRVETYVTLRHPRGGRKDRIAISETAGGLPIFALELYRPGAELRAFPPAADALAELTELSPRRIQAAGLVRSKFGAVPLIGFWRKTPVEMQVCAGFALDFELPQLRISGFSCAGDTLPEQRQLIACALDRLTMHSYGNDPRLAALFARAELKRKDCRLRATQEDWVTAPQDPALRGAFAFMRR